MATTPQSLPPSFKPVFYDENQPDDLHTYSSSTSHASSPESRPVDITSPIPEEEEDETSSEAANEPLTPIDSHHPPTFQDKMNGTATAYGALHTQPPLILNTSPTPPPSAGKDKETPVAGTPPKTPIQKRPTLTSRDSTSGIKKVMSGFFKRSNSHSANLQTLTMTDSTLPNGSDPMLAKEHRRLSIRRMSTTTSPTTTRSNTPPSPASPAEFEEKQPQTRLQVQEPSENEFFHSRKKNRSSTGFSLRDRMQKQSKVTFTPDEKDTNQDHRRHRATSVDLDGAHENRDNGTQVQRISRQVWGMAAETGIGLKSRRMSLSLPDDFTVDVVDLYTEYSDQSKLLGRRGKSVGKGATANVKLMNRKGGCAGEVYAVKEFRGKSSNEKAEDYEKKVKSEYSIAKSVHHPNIVETFRLCTHNGRWNHVMEFCDQGDLFSLVNQKYLAKDCHQVDRLCLFKQLIQGLNYLHSNGIAHRDVKLENLLITKDSKLKITDFGVSEVFAGIHPGLRAAGGQCGKDMQEVRLCAPGICGSPPYIAPEVIAKNGKHNCESISNPF